MIRHDNGQKKKGFEIPHVLKEKHDGTFKARGCADG